MGIEAARAAVGVLEGGLVHRALAGADGADHVEALLAAQHLPLHEQPFLAVGVDDHAGGAVAVAGIEVLVPEIHRLEDVTVGVDDVVGAGHGRAPFADRILGRHSSSAARRAHLP